jgi:NADPH:quinone reductase
MRVMGMTRSGALAEEIVVKPEALHPLPDGVAAEVAASFRANYLTALYALSARAMIVFSCWAPPAAPEPQPSRSASCSALA